MNINVPAPADVAVRVSEYNAVCQHRLYPPYNGIAMTRNNMRYTAFSVIEMMTEVKKLDSRFCF
ncbi:MAG: hypothetical protein OSJ74_08460 [Clostridia bacterium]|nr:hypothetical protein [Clostridia bacterium]